MSAHRYKITYNAEVHPEGIVKADIPKGQGATDDLIIGSIIRDNEGWNSYATISLSGKTGDALDPIDLFRYWLFLSEHLNETLPPGWQRDLTTESFEKARGIILAERAK